MNIHSLNMGFSHAYLLETEAGLYLVDAGLPGSEGIVTRRMRSIGRTDLRLIFITHAHLDHYGSAAALRRLTGAPVAIHHADAVTIAKGESPLGTVRGNGKIVKVLFPLIDQLLALEPLEPDLILEQGDSLQHLGLDARLLHLPGHTPGSSALMVDGGYAFVGDLLSTSGKPHLQRFYADDWSLIPRSLTHLVEQKPSWVYPGHGSSPLAGSELGSLVAQAV